MLDLTRVVNGAVRSSPVDWQLSHKPRRKERPKMEAPSVANILKDEANGVTYRVMAYRTMTANEIMHSIALYLRQRKGKKPKRGTMVTIISIIGFDGM